MDPPKRISLTLTIDKKQQRVLYARADKAFVDFIFSILIVPLGRSSVGCLPNIYQSVKDFKDDYMVSKVEKRLLLNTKSPMPLSSYLDNKSPMLLSSYLLPIAPNPITATTTTTSTFYRCHSDTCAGQTYLFSSSRWDAKCWLCQKPITTTSNHPLADGFVKGGVAKYMVMDDLSVTDFDPSSLLLFFRKMNVNSLDAVEERIVHIDIGKSAQMCSLVVEKLNVALKRGLRRSMTST